MIYDHRQQRTKVNSDVNSIKETCHKLLKSSDPSNPTGLSNGVDRVKWHTDDGIDQVSQSVVGKENVWNCS